MIKVEDEVDQVVVAKTYAAEQGHVFRFWGRLTPVEQRALLDQLATFDFQQLERLVKLIEAEPGPKGELAPISPLTCTPERRAELEEIGWQALREGKVACVVVAGGQGTRLGWPSPKGTYPVGPVSKKSLYQLFAEQILATGLRAGRPLDWYVLTSRSNREESEAFFKENDMFGLDPEQVYFLVQGDLPNTDGRGKLLMASTSAVATSPDGHGGTFLAVKRGALKRMSERGQDYLFYWQVDNPLCRVADPVFLGAHIEATAEASTKVVKKTDPGEKVGLLALRGGKMRVVEYSELTDETQELRDESGDLVYRGGNTAIHLFSREFLVRLEDDDFQLTHHLARKAVATVDEQGEPLVPDEPNAIKFETFIFDLLSEAKAHVALEVDRGEEFEPLKNKSGPYSPETVKRAQSDRAARWLQAAGLGVPKGVICEISPLTALDPKALQEAQPELPAPKENTIYV